MRTMASAYFLVAVLVIVQKVYGDICDLDPSELSCDECIRCGGYWCNDRGIVHCQMSPADSWCPSNQESLSAIPEIVKPGDLIQPIYAERTLNVNIQNILDIHYTARSPDSRAKIKLTNSTQSFNLDIKEINVECSGLQCTSKIEAVPRIDFCAKTGTSREFVQAEVNVGGLNETIVVKYHIPCACECTHRVSRSAIECNTHGDLSCGVCKCDHGWTGENCSKPICPEKRGDVQCTSKNGRTCSGNGYCGVCETCVCYTDREGSQYFNAVNDCSDICMDVNACDICLVNNTLGICHDCMSNPLYVQNYNDSLLDERDYLNRSMWVNCNETVDGCFVSYVAKKDEYEHIIVMVVESCNTVITGAHGSGAKVSIVAGVLGILAVVAALGGIMYWHHMNAIPAVKPNNPGYQNIVAEDIVGQNPIYQDPWSSFKNPTYGDKP